MILRRYGETVQSVELAFDSKALSEVGFRRDRAVSIPGEEFDGAYELVTVHELAETTEGDVHDEVESAMLRKLEGHVRSLQSELAEDEVLYVESKSGVDYPKTRSVTKNVIVEGENRLHFTVRLEPALRLGVYRRRG
ncbi:MAG TPA: hypothetical protein VGA70_01175 [Longimicrobiales bacterium]|jgi:hypothetical protein